MTWPTSSPPPPQPSLPPPGWYPDPSGQLLQRWWDGVRWTEHVATPPPPSPHNRQHQVALGSGPAELAGWWRRFGGYVLDVLIVDVPVFIVSTLIGLTQRHNVVPGTTYWHLDTAAQFAVVIASLAIILGYPYLLLRHNGQTVGMMAAGIRAVDRTLGTPPTSRQAAVRVLTFFVLVVLWQQIAVIFGFHHVYGPRPSGEILFQFLAGALALTTGLWPLGNARNQTLQDKAAGTLVVRSRS
jgi:uncharacterized RDD family membrane protein YckC